MINVHNFYEIVSNIEKTLGLIVYHKLLLSLLPIKKERFEVRWEKVGIKRIKDICLD